MKLCNETLEQELYRSFCRSCFYRVRIKATAWMAGERDNVDGSGMVLRGTDLLICRHHKNGLSPQKKIGNKNCNVSTPVRDEGRNGSH
jgi:hypothetical protein